MVEQLLLVFSKKCLDFLIANTCHMSLTLIESISSIDDFILLNWLKLLSIFKQLVTYSN